MKNRNDIDVEMAAEIWMDRAQGADPFYKTIVVPTDGGGHVYVRVPDEFEHQPCCGDKPSRAHLCSLDHISTMAGTNPINLARIIVKKFHWCAYCQCKQGPDCGHISILNPRKQGVQPKESA